MKVANVQFALISMSSFFLGCQREPVPSPNKEACAAMCALVACIDPGLDSDEIEQCESHCLDKFSASEAQGVDCADVYAEGMACLAELSCSEYEGWLAETPDGSCPNARTRVQDFCEQIFLEPHILPP